MKRFLTLLVALGVVALATPEDAQAQHWHRGGSGFAISIGNGFGPGWGGGFGPGFYGRPAGVSFGYSSFRPSYGYGHYHRPVYGYGYRGGYRGGYGGRGCGGW